ncbi:MAG: hypothetical protein PGN29_04625 [Gordonia paraffinivorans]
MKPSPRVRWSAAAFRAGDPNDLRVICGYGLRPMRARLDAADAAMALLVELLPVDEIPVFLSVTVGAQTAVIGIAGLGDDLSDHQRVVDSWLGLSRPNRSTWTHRRSEG